MNQLNLAFKLPSYSVGRHIYRKHALASQKDLLSFMSVCQCYWCNEQLHI